MKLQGCYCLIIHKRKTENLNIGKIYKNKRFEEGYYVYIGSAMNSLIARIKRHLSEDKKLHWHIDYLLKNKNTKIEEVLFNISSKKIECELANKIFNKGKNNQKEIINFGCSDCDCNSHLIYFKSKNNALNNVKKAYAELKIEYYDLEYFYTIE